MAAKFSAFKNDTMDNDSLADFMIFNQNESISELEESRRNLVGYLEVVIAILLLVCNLFIVCVIFASKKLRNSSKHLLVLNLSFVDLIKVFALALNVYMMFGGRITYKCDLQYISLLITDLTTALSGAFIFLLHIDYLASNNTTSIYPGKRLIGPVLLAFFCYIFTGAMLVPTYVLHLQPETYDISTGNCWPFNREGTYLLYEALSVVPHSLLILVSGGMTIGAYISRSYLLNISKELNLVRRPVDLNLAGALTVLLHCVPYLYGIVKKLICGCLPCSEMTGLDILIPFLPFLKCVILPFVWLFCPDFRTALSLCCIKRQKRVTIKLPAEIENNRFENNSKETNSKSPKLNAKAEPSPPPPAKPESEVIELITDENSDEKVLMV